MYYHQAAFGREAKGQAIVANDSLLKLNSTGRLKVYGCAPYHPLEHVQRPAESVYSYSSIYTIV